MVYIEASKYATTLISYYKIEKYMTQPPAAFWRTAYSLMHRMGVALPERRSPTDNRLNR